MVLLQERRTRCVEDVMTTSIEVPRFLLACVLGCIELLSPAWLYDKTTELEGMVGQRQHLGEILEATTRRFSHQTLETGPLKSEAQGLDLSVNTVWSELRRLPSIRSNLLPGHRTTLLCNVVLATSGDAASMHTLTWVLWDHWRGKGSA